MGGVPWITNLGYVIKLEDGYYYQNINNVILRPDDFKAYILNRSKEKLVERLGRSGLLEDYEYELGKQILADGHWYLTKE